MTWTFTATGNRESRRRSDRTRSSGILGKQSVAAGASAEPPGSPQGLDFRRSSRRARGPNEPVRGLESAALPRCEIGGGGGNRTRVRAASSERVYVRRRRSFSARSVAAPGGIAPRPTCFSPPVTAGQRPGTSPLLRPLPARRRRGRASPLVKRRVRSSCRQLLLPTVPPVLRGG